MPRDERGTAESSRATAARQVTLGASKSHEFVPSRARTSPACSVVGDGPVVCAATDVTEFVRYSPPNGPVANSGPGQRVGYLVQQCLVNGIVVEAFSEVA